MKIRILQTIKHEGRQYAEGDQVTLDEGTATYFCKTGWAERLDGEAPAVDAPPANVTLEVDKAEHTTTNTEI